jgi:hypothetical protein
MILLINFTNTTEKISIPLNKILKYRILNPKKLNFPSSKKLIYNHINKYLNHKKFPSKQILLQKSILDKHKINHHYLIIQKIF